MIKKISTDEANKLAVEKRETSPSHDDIRAALSNGPGCYEVDISEFCSLNSAYGTYHAAVKKSGYEIYVKRRSGRLFLFVPEKLGGGRDA